MCINGPSSYPHHHNHTNVCPLFKFLAHFPYSYHCDIMVVPVNGSSQRSDVRLVGMAFTISLVLISVSVVFAHQHVNHTKIDPMIVETPKTSFLAKVMDFLWNSSGSGYQHTWPVSVLTYQLFFLIF